MRHFPGSLLVRYWLSFFVILTLGTASAEEAVEAAASCVVTHEESGAENERSTTCFENISLERTSFESGVCQWKTNAQATAKVQTTTRFVPYCPTSYTAYCDRLVLGSGIIAPVKIFLYDKSEDVLARAKKQCTSGGGAWSTNDADAAE
jgi:hypothetical protein